MRSQPGVNRIIWPPRSLLLSLRNRFISSTLYPHLVLVLAVTGGQPLPGLGLRQLPVERPQVPLGLVQPLRLDRVSQSENQKTFYLGFYKEHLLQQCVFVFVHPACDGWWHLWKLQPASKIMKLFLKRVTFYQECVFVDPAVLSLDDGWWHLWKLRPSLE